MEYVQQISHINLADVMSAFGPRRGSLLSDRRTAKADCQETTQLARNLAVQWGPKGVRVNAVAPGLIRTPLSAQLMSDEAFMSRRLEMTPLRRVGEVDDVADLCLFLASHQSSFITGQHIAVDGGTSITDGS